MINPSKFYDEVKAAGLPLYTISIAPLSSSVGPVIDVGGVWVEFTRVLTAPETTTLNTVIAAHDPIDYVAQTQNGSEAAAAAIPNWAAWKLSDWNTYYNANISATQITAIANLADAKVVMAKMSTVIDNLVKMEIALRNKVFPKLQG